MCGRPMFEDALHVFPVRVYYEDTDAAGIVYYASYLRFAERARTELTRALGLSHARLLNEAGILFAVRRCTADFLAPARLDDLLAVHTSLTHLGGASVDMQQTIRRGHADLVRLAVRLACVGSGGRPERIPDAVRNALMGYQQRAGVPLDQWTMP